VRNTIKNSQPLLVLAIPLALTGILEYGVFFFETLFLARLGPNELAAGGLVSWLFGTFFVILFGVLSAINVLVAQKHGAGDTKGISLVLRDGLCLTLLFLLPCCLLFWNMSYLFLFLGQDPNVVELAKPYLHALVWGIFPDLVMIALLEFMIGLGHTRAILVFSILAVPVTIFLSFALIFGKFGLPALGIAGAGWGTTIGYWITGILLTMYVFLSKKYALYTSHLFLLTKATHLWELLKIGVPMGLMYCIEVGFFFVLSLLMGSMSSELLAANQIVLQYMGTLMSLAFAIAQAVTVRMGHLLGEGNTLAAIQTSYSGMFLSISTMLIVAITYWAFPNQLIAIDLNPLEANNARISTLACEFLAICAMFQILDSVRIVLFGALRALRDTHFSLLVSVLSFWGIALPIGYVLATYAKLGGKGLWWGMVIGAAISIPLLVVRFNYQVKGHRARTSIDNPSSLSP
jgi:MATE family multidrug resistance protein